MCKMIQRSSESYFDHAIGFESCSVLIPSTVNACPVPQVDFHIIKESEGYIA